ncbi:MAG: hypothetical protein J5629_04490 [Muribaculaceae bacterium]|nr:hypothetical protein [Muribaculaceae bacterium]
MRRSRFIISLVLMLPAFSVMADSVDVAQPAHEELVGCRKHWATALIPSQLVIQNAGNMGVVSLGAGWCYGKKGHWETHLLFGYVPKHQSSRGKATMTLKENYLPWNINLKRGWSVQPLQASVYLNTIFGNEFWVKEPDRYPDNYYPFVSTRFRLNVALGQRVTWQIPGNNRKVAKSVSLFYEVSSCDFYIRSKFFDNNVPLKNILGLSFGVKLQIL